MVHKPDTSTVLLSGPPVFCMFSSLMCMSQGTGGGGREVWPQRTIGVCTTPSGLPLTVSWASISRLRVTESAVASPIYPFSHKHTAHTLLYTGKGLTYTCLHTYCMLYVLARTEHCVASFPSYLCCIRGTGQHFSVVFWEKTTDYTHFFSKSFSKSETHIFVTLIKWQRLICWRLYIRQITMFKTK